MHITHDRVRKPAIVCTAGDGWFPVEKTFTPGPPGDVLLLWSRCSGPPADAGSSSPRCLKTC